MELVVDPVDGLIDKVPTVRLGGARPGGTVLLRARTRDASGSVWESSTGFTADREGRIDLGRDAPTSGDYTRVDPSGPIWAMRFADTDRAPSIFTPSAEPITITFESEADGARSQVSVVRRWAGAGVTRSPLPGSRFTGRLFEPDDPTRTGGSMVVLFPGSTGAAAVEPWAALLASYGHRASVMAYMAEPGLPTSMREIPLEALDQALEAAARLAEGGPLTVISFSVGTMGALSVLAQLSTVAVSAVISIAPSHVIWQALGSVGPPPKTSGWSLRGTPLPWVPIRGERLLPEMLGLAVKRRVRRRPTVTALHMRTAYRAGLADHAAVSRAAIPVERIAAPMLLISGDRDSMWPGSEMAAALLARRRAAGLTGDEHLALPESGHFVRPPVTPTTVTWDDELHSGGTPEGCAAGEVEAWRRIRAFIDRHRTPG
jgi:pimeloyl-ACP methyl ester carboxylesterase